MNTYLKRFLYIFIANISLMQSIALAVPKTPAHLRVDRNDFSLQILEQVFGFVDGVLYGTGSQVVGKMFGMFNASVIALGGIFLTYTLLVSTINTAQDGEVMGKQWSSIWIPMRVTAGVALLAPKASGYCMMQIFVIWIVVQGVGAANQVWDAALTYLEDGGVLTSVPLAYAKKSQNNLLGTQPTQDDSPMLLDEAKLKQASHMLDSLVCLRALEHSINDWENAVYHSGVYTKKRVPDFFDTTNIISAWQKQTDKSKPLQVPLPNFDEGPFKDLNGFCGKVTVTPFKFTNQDNATLDENGRAVDMQVMEDRTQQAVLIASQEMMEELYKVATIMGDRNEEQMRLYRNGQVNDEDKDVGVRFVGDEYSKTGSCESDECAEWGPATSLLSGYELQTSVLSYYSILLPFLNQLNRKASEIEFIPHARKQGWLMAGSYFYDMTRLNMRMNSIKPEKYFQLDVEPGNYSDIIEQKNKFKKLQTELLDDGSAFDLYKDFIKNVYYGAGDKKRLARGLQGIWRQNIDKDSDIPIDDHLDEILKDLKKRQVPESIYKPVSYNSYFKFSNVLRVPFSKRQPKSCSIMRLAKCFGDNMTIGMWNVAVSIWNAIADFINAFFLAPLEKLLDLTVGNLINIGLTGVFASISNVDNHPIINLASTGQDLMEFSWDSFLTLISLFLVASLVAFPFAKTFWDVLGKRIVALLLVILVVFGYSFAFYAPLLPYMIFLFAGLGWVIAVVESVVAAPIVALGLTHPEGQNQVWGKAENAIMLIVNVFLRPSLMIVGYIIAILVSYAFIHFAAYSFSHINDQLLGYSAPVNPADYETGIQAFQHKVLNYWSRGGQTGIVSVLGPLMMMFLFMFLYLEVVKKSFSLIHVLPDQVMRWLAGGMQEQFGSMTAGQMEQGTGQQYQKAEQHAAPTPKVLDGLDPPMRVAEQNAAADA